MLKTLYTIFLGLMLALFVGVGVATFYAAPKAPDYSAAPQLVKPSPTDAELAQQQAQQAEFQAKNDAFQKAESTYNRNVSLIALGFATLFLVIALWFPPHFIVLADGLLLGGVFTLVYGIIRGLMSQDNAQRFVVISIGLVIAIIIGYKKFVETQEESAKKH